MFCLHVRLICLLSSSNDLSESSHLNKKRRFFTYNEIDTRNMRTGSLAVTSRWSNIAGRQNIDRHIFLRLQHIAIFISDFYSIKSMSNIIFRAFHNFSSVHLFSFFSYQLIALQAFFLYSFLIIHIYRNVEMLHETRLTFSEIPFAIGNRKKKCLIETWNILCKGNFFIDLLDFPIFSKMIELYRI